MPHAALITPPRPNPAYAAGRSRMQVVGMQAKTLTANC
jgi:hypothetical protein